MQYQRQFAEMVRRWSARDFSAKWRNAAVPAQRMKWKTSESVAENARRVLPKLAQDYFEAGRKAVKQKQSAKALHRFRLATKRFRYALELFRPLYGPSLDRHLKAVHAIQDALGKISDYQTIQDLIAGDQEIERES